MTDLDFEKFARWWETARELMAGGSQPLSHAAMTLAFDALAKYPLEKVEKAIQHHVLTAKFAPTPGDIAKLLDGFNQRLSADEAWAECPKSEFDTAVWTREMAEAYAVCSDFLAEGRAYDAGRAFRAAYDRICQQAVLMQAPVVWSVCVGFDKSNIAPVIERAVRLGRLSRQVADKYLPAPAESVVVGFLAHDKTVDDSRVLRNLRGLKKSLQAGDARSDKRIGILQARLSGSLSEHERYLAESELALLTDAKALRNEAETWQLAQDERRSRFETSRREALAVLKSLKIMPLAWQKPDFRIVDLAEGFEC